MSECCRWGKMDEVIAIDRQNEETMTPEQQEKFNTFFGKMMSDE